MEKTWAEVSCEVPAEMVDDVSEFLVELSSNGVSIENLTLDTFSLETVEDAPVKGVKAYFPLDNGIEDKLAAIGSYLRENGPPFAGFVFKAPTVKTLREEDWANNWKEHFKPARIGKRIIIKPTWEDYQPSPGDIILEVDPGMAFGTGTHPTTRLCLEAMEGIVCREGSYADAPRKLETALDVGTGSGILAIGAVKLGIERVTAIDIDPESVHTAQENININGATSAVSVSGALLQDLEGSFDLILANILAEALVELSGELVRRLNPGGFLILSGILTEKEELAANGFAPFGLRLVETSREGDWSCLAYRMVN